MATDQTRAAILNAAEQLYAERGFSEVTLRDIVAAAGVNLAAMWVDGLLGRPLPALPDYRVGVGYRREEGDVQALLRQLMRGPRRSSLRALRSERPTEYAVASWSDPRPFVTSIGHGIRHVRRRPPAHLPATPADAATLASDGAAERVVESGS